jgi:signal transduction histidine kinase
MTICGGTTGDRGRAYPGCVHGIAGTVARKGRWAWPAAAWLWRGLAGAAWGGDPAPAWRSPWWRRVAYGGLAGVAGLLAVVSLASAPRLGGPAGLFGYQAFTVNGAVANQGVVAKQSAKRQIAINHAVTAVHATLFRPAGLIALNNPMGITTLDVLVALAVVVPVALVARYPLLGWRLGVAGLWLVPWAHVGWRWGWWWGPVLLAGVVGCFAVAGTRQSRGVLGWMWAVTLVPWLWHQGLGGTGVAGCLGLGAVAVAADAMAARRRAQLVAAGQAERAELERARRAVLEERARIARELHDVVAHHLSLIAVRAESAPYRLAGLGDGAAAEFGSLSGAAREALTDMRRLLGVLRAEGPAARAPQPRLADVPELVAAARRAGVAVALDGPPAWAPVPAGVGVCAYRIVQESLSNASRHAPGAPVSVTVGNDDQAVSLQVSNGPGHAADPPDTGGRADATGPGHGLAGMRERVALLGGTLTAGPAPGGGFVVSAILPITQAA